MYKNLGRKIHSVLNLPKTILLPADVILLSNHRGQLTWVRSTRHFVRDDIVTGDLMEKKKQERSARTVFNMFAFQNRKTSAASKREETVP